MKPTLVKSFRFEAAHYLPHAPEGHKCRRVHGHSFICEIEISGEVDEEIGWLMDFKEINKAFRPILDQLDHHFLNEDIPELKNPTSENICRWIWDNLKPGLPQLSAVTLQETRTSRCVYKGE